MTTRARLRRLVRPADRRPFRPSPAVQRDQGFAALVAGRSLLDVCVRDRVPPSAIVKSILSKGSVKYGLGMQKGRLEGSKEFLGSLAM